MVGGRGRTKRTGLVGRDWQPVDDGEDANPAIAEFVEDAQQRQVFLPECKVVGPGFDRGRIGSGEPDGSDEARFRAPHGLHTGSQRRTSSPWTFPNCRDRKWDTSRCRPGERLRNADGDCTGWGIAVVGMAGLAAVEPARD